MKKIKFVFSLLFVAVFFSSCVKDFEALVNRIEDLEAKLSQTPSNENQRQDTLTNPAAVDLSALENALAELQERLELLEGATAPADANLDNIILAVSELQNALDGIKNADPEAVDFTPINEQIDDLRTEIANLPLIPQSDIDAILSRLEALENALEKHHPATSGTHEEHEWVDLGLSVMWATYNIGATSPDEPGDYFAWGATLPQTSYALDMYFDKTYEKYNESKTILDDKDDVANAEWHGAWRMPTVEEFDELYKNCTSEWITFFDVAGRLFTSKTTGESIFLPAAGRYIDDAPVKVGETGYYWTRSLNETKINYAYTPNFTATNQTTGGGYDRQNGQPVRAVYPRVK